MAVLKAFVKMALTIIPEAELRISAKLGLDYESSALEEIPILRTVPS
jgi:hypothetical protein